MTRRFARQALPSGSRARKDRNSGARSTRCRQQTSCRDAACPLEKEASLAALEEELACAPAALQVNLRVKTVQEYVHECGYCVKYQVAEKLVRRRKAAQQWERRTAAGQHRAQCGNSSALPDSGKGEGGSGGQ